MIYVYIIGGVSILSFILLAVMFYNARAGWEDENGFHEGRKK